MLAAARVAGARCSRGRSAPDPDWAGILGLYMTVRAEPIDRLRDDVRLLGELVGDVLREQGGVELFEAVEYIRRAAIELRVDPTLGSGAAGLG